jgi:hypothetical protein
LEASYFLAGLLSGIAILFAFLIMMPMEWLE